MIHLLMQSNDKQIFIFCMNGIYIMDIVKCWKESHTEYISILKNQLEISKEIVTKYFFSSNWQSNLKSALSHGK